MRLIRIRNTLQVTNHLAKASIIVTYLMNILVAFLFVSQCLTKQTTAFCDFFVHLLCFVTMRESK